MANALLASSYQLSTVNAAASFLTNDYIGLVYSVALATGQAHTVVLDLGSPKAVDVAAILGLPLGMAGRTIQWRASNSADMSGAVNVGTFPGVFGGQRTSETAKHLAKFDARTYRYWSFTVNGGAATQFRAWRVVLGLSVQPDENISIGAEEGIDDRSVRRYARSGSRVIDGNVIVPTFQGEWPWLEEEEYKLIRSMLRTYGATVPYLFVLDPDPASPNPFGGEDGIFYGDMEKNSKLRYDEGYYSFSIAIVALAP